MDKSSHSRAFGFIPVNGRETKPRRRAITEIRGPYYTPVGVRYLEDLLDAFGEYVDMLKFAGGSFTLMPEKVLKEIIDLCHRHGVLVDTGGYIERVITHGVEAVNKYIDECKRVGFDVVEVSKGFISIPPDDLLRITERAVKAGLKVKAEVGIQFGAGGASTVEALESEGTSDPGFAIDLARRQLEAGASMIMVESEGITESVKDWKTDVIARFMRELGSDKTMFEAADPAVFGWYVKNYGPEVNLFIDHSQIVLLESLRSGIWGTNDLWGRVHAYKG